MAQLLDVFALNSQEAMLHMANVGAMRCLVEILVGDECLTWAAEREGCTQEHQSWWHFLKKLLQQHWLQMSSPGNAEATVEAATLAHL
jgi:hypothetical protein